jgi:hypothetical protein
MGHLFGRIGIKMRAGWLVHESMQWNGAHARSGRASGIPSDPFKREVWNAIDRVYLYRIKGVEIGTIVPISKSIDRQQSRLRRRLN